MKTIKTISIIFGFAVFFISAFLLFEPSRNPTGFFVYTPYLEIINQEKYEPLNSELKIGIITIVTYNLVITTLKGDMEFIELRCGDKILNPLVKGNKIIYNDYSCKGNGFLLVKILSKELNLESRFGEKIQQVQNTVS